ncbi:MAG: radical SAM protein [Myxococcota bacterium]|nr:radical SAM protein [Myxococcota bacterium]
MKITFIFPPQWSAAHPHYGMSLLAGQLRNAGHVVDIVDLNLEFIEHVLTSQSAGLTYEKIRLEEEFLRKEVKLRQAVNDVSDDFTSACEKLSFLQEHGSTWQDWQSTYIEQWGEAPNKLRDAKCFFEPHEFVSSYLAISRALDFFSAPFFPNHVAWNFFSHPRTPLNIEPMVEFCSSAESNPFFEFYEECLPNVLHMNCDLIAISIGAFSQVLPGLTLAMMLKKARTQQPNPLSGKKWHLTIGGNFFTRLKSSLESQPNFFQAFTDTLTIGEGEQSIVALAETLSDQSLNKTLEAVPSLLFLDEKEDRVISTPDAPQKSMNSMAFQDLAGFNLERYHAPEPVICLRATKGCYWGHCTFCDSYYGLREDTMAIERLIAEMTYLNKEYGVSQFEFVDQCLEPHFLLEMSEAIIKANLKVQWFCNGLTESRFNKEVFVKMKEAGATMIMWGIESGSPRLLKLMRKGVNPKRRLSILKDASDAGLWNFAYLFFGFPSETSTEAMQTIDLVIENRDIIHSYGKSIFSLGKHSPLMADPKRYGILKLIENRQDFSSELTYEVSSGLQGEELSRISQQCAQMCQQAYANPLWMALRTRESLHLYLARRGRDYVGKYKFSEDSTIKDLEFVF